MIFIKKILILTLNKTKTIFIKNNYKKDILKVFCKYFLNIKIFFELFIKLRIFYIFLLSIIV